MGKIADRCSICVCIGRETRGGGYEEPYCVCGREEGLG